MRNHIERNPDYDALKGNFQRMSFRTESPK
jgi:hypothetical protein